MAAIEDATKGKADEEITSADEPKTSEDMETPEGEAEAEGKAEVITHPALTTLAPPAPAPPAASGNPLPPGPPPPNPYPRYGSPAVAPYHPPPDYPPPPNLGGAPSDARGVAAMLAAIGGILLGLPLGLPGLALGPLAYFLGRSAVSRIDASHGAVGGRGLASAAWVMGVVATAIGAVSSLAWLIFILLAISGTPPTQ